MLAEVDRGLLVLRMTNKDRVPLERSMVLSGGIERLVEIQKRENRNLEEERGIAQTVNKTCNCDGQDKSSSPTFLSLVSCSLENPILSSAYSKEGRHGSPWDMGKFLFLGLVQGDGKKPWTETSDKNEWYLKFGANKFGANKDDVKYNIIYYAPIKGLDKVKLNASAF